ncbi:hypothetical protein [Solidesulfovibrio sp.]|nr:hypothetical protein [Solidesulfovibrio sp.]MEA4857531.1 hypothetical protein [Solidesulfovibrio sp.]
MGDEKKDEKKEEEKQPPTKTTNSDAPKGPGPVIIRHPSPGMGKIRSR